MKTLSTLNQTATDVLLHLVDLVSEFNSENLVTHTDTGYFTNLEKGEMTDISQRLRIEVINSDFDNTTLKGWRNIKIHRYGHSVTIHFLILNKECIPYCYSDDFSGHEDKILNISNIHDFAITDEIRTKHKKLIGYANKWLEKINTEILDTMFINQEV